MGKTAVCTALVLAAPAKLPKMSDKTFKMLLDPEQAHGVLHFKATVIVVNNTLVQQAPPTPT